MAMASSRPRVVLGLSDELGDSLTSAEWIGAFVSLGSYLRRYLGRLVGRQLVLAISVPRRDSVAALIGTGWMLSSSPPKLEKPIEVFRAAGPSTYLRAVTDRLILTGRFSKLDESRPDPLVLTAGRTFPADRFRAVSVLDEETPALVCDVPEPGYLAMLTGAVESWLERLASPPMDLALVGTAKWLFEDLEAVIGNSAVMGELGTPLRTYVLPRTEKGATWSTTVIPSAQLGEGSTLPESCVMAILDRYGAIKYLNDITVPIVVCVIDRSIADESAAELIVEARSANSQPISVKGDLRWVLPRSVESMAFTVAL